MRITLIGFLFLFLYFCMGYIYTQHNVEILMQNRYKVTALNMKRELMTLIKDKQEAVLLVGISLAQNPSLKTLLRNKKSDNLELNHYSKILQENTSLKNIWLQILDNQGKSIYRSWTDKTGDILTDARADVKKMIEHPEILSSISTGKYDMTFKTMVPIYEGSKFVGIVETLAKFDSIVQKMQESNYKTLIVVDGAYKKQLSQAYTNSFIEDFYVASLQTDSKLVKIVQENSVSSFLNIDSYKVDVNNSLLFSLYKLSDINGQDMSYFIIAQDLNKINIEDIIQNRNRIIIGLLFGLAVITGFLFYLYAINYKKFIEEQKEKLEEQVEHKTQALKVQSEELRHIAHHDSLTNLPNRLLFFDRLEQAIKHAKRENEKMAVLFLDLDRFKEINDTYGHETGDKLLQVVTTRLQECVREEDTIARLGGDEFTILLQNISNENVIKISNNILTIMQKPCIVKNLELFVSFSIGISCYPQDGENANILLRNSDTAMYRAKERGKNNYQFYNVSMTDIAMERVALQKDIRQALERKEFEAYYQPKIDAQTLKVVGLEALIRWNHPTKGLIYPNDFIPFAEEVGLIIDIDAYMMRNTLREIQEWRDEGVETGRLSLNLSARQLESEESTKELEETIEEIGFNTKYLELEVTESHIMRNPIRAIKVLDHIKSLGIQISVDDFGTGYSSLSYLKELPVDSLKIDRSFVVDMMQSEEDRAIVKIIISLAENLKLDVIAEGVESKEQVDCLLKQGCKIIQGYYFSKPLPAEKCKAYLLEHQ